MCELLVDVYMASLWRQGHVVKSVKSLLENDEVGSITISCNNYTDEQWNYVCGDTLFLQYKIPEFTGYDVSEFIINENRKKSKHIFTTNINDLTSYELTISMDVILHLMEEDVYNQYMVDLFRLSSRYVIIYSPNRNQIFSGIHNKFREFMPDVPKNFKLIEHVINPHKGDNTQADFYVFELV